MSNQHKTFVFFPENKRSGVSFREWTWDVQIWRASQAIGDDWGPPTPCPLRVLHMTSTMLHVYPLSASRSWFQFSRPSRFGSNSTFCLQLFARKSEDYEKIMRLGKWMQSDPIWSNGRHRARRQQSLSYLLASLLALVLNTHRNNSLNNPTLLILDLFVSASIFILELAFPSNLADASLLLISFHHFSLSFSISYLIYSYISLISFLVAFLCVSTFPAFCNVSYPLLQQSNLLGRCVAVRCHRFSSVSSDSSWGLEPLQLTKSGRKLSRPKLAWRDHKSLGNSGKWVYVNMDHWIPLKIIRDLFCLHDFNIKMNIERIMASFPDPNLGESAPANTANAVSNFRAISAPECS